MADNISDNGVARAGHAPDPHGLAAYLLVESLLHELVAQSAISNESAVRIVDIANEVGGAMALEEEAHSERDAMEILRILALSLRSDEQGDANVE